MGGSILWNVVTPVLTFGAVSAAAVNFLIIHMLNAGLLTTDERCPSPWVGKGPYQLKYLGGYAPAIEQALCIGVNFWNPLFQPEAASNLPLIHDYLASFAAPIAVTLLEASRANRPLLLAFSMIWGLLYQNLGSGVIYPLYWAFFIAITGNTAGSHIDQASAEAVLFGLFMGFAAPTATMVYFGTAESIAAWEMFPVWISVFQHLHLLFRPRRSHSGSGHRTVQATYIFVFLASSIVHLRGLSAYDFEVQAIVDVFIPSLEMPDASKGHTSLTSAIHFLQWNVVFVFGSTLLTSLWFAESIAGGILSVLWSMTSTAVLGPGAAVSGIFLWREAKLKQKRQKQGSRGRAR